MSVRGLHTADPKLGHQIVDRTEFATTRPALERAGWKCEGCKNDDSLRVCQSGANVVVLCPLCRLDGTFKKVVAWRKYKQRSVR